MKNNIKKIIIAIVILLIILIFGIVIYSSNNKSVVYDEITEEETEPETEEVIEIVIETEKETEPETEEETEAVEESAAENTDETVSYDYNFTEDLESLRAKNSDIVGWITIPGTVINYPIVQGPDNDYYLHRDVNKQSSTAGAIFLDYADNPDFSSLHNIIYGHHMKNGSMFKGLENFKTQSYFNTHRDVYIETPERTIHLRTLAALYVKSDAIRRKTQFESDEEFQQYIRDMIKNAQAYAEPEQEIYHLYSLITCSYEVNNARTILYAYEVEDPPEENEDDIIEEEPEDDEIVLVKDYIPDIFIELRYATDNNFTGQIVYDFDDAYLRYGTVKKLKAVQEQIQEEGYSLKIWDAFRPVEAQFKLWEICPDPAYVANPNTGYSSHSKGNTVDITLVRNDGTEIVMPTDFDSFSTKADRDYSDCTEEEAANARYLENVMRENGFNPYSAEWWHFSDTNSYDVVQ